ncbi:hypothetical protein EDC01DRAFT_299025 [Geopyxis carbonaria]|nr:hypothetical protein EDC01DRAFT_299025 [Geopyxis carbonaria]
MYLQPRFQTPSHSYCVLWYCVILKLAGLTLSLQMPIDGIWYFVHWRSGLHVVNSRSSLEERSLRTSYLVLCSLRSGLTFMSCSSLDVTISKHPCRKLHNRRCSLLFGSFAVRSYIVAYSRSSLEVTVGKCLFLVFVLEYLDFSVLGLQLSSR